MGDASLLEHLEARVAGDAYDADAWGALLSETSQREPSVFRPVFERCVATYPSSPGVWRQWIDAELRNGQLQPAEELFGRCLLTVPYLELWQLYLVYLGQKGAPAQEMQQAYELLFEAVGADANAGAVWLEYIGKLQAAVAPGTPASSATVAATRRAFRAALVQPVGGLENIWKTYEDWLNQISPDTAKQELSDWTEKAAVARRVGRERKTLRRALRLDDFARPPRGAPSEAAQLDAYRKIWRYEATNPQRLDAAPLQKRMVRIDRPPARPPARDRDRAADAHVSLARRRSSSSRGCCRCATSRRRGSRRRTGTSRTATRRRRASCGPAPSRWCRAASHCSSPSRGLRRRKGTQRRPRSSSRGRWRRGRRPSGTSS